MLQQEQSQIWSDARHLIRSQSASYRELVLRNYAYMRDAKRDRFYHPKLNRSLWDIQMRGHSPSSSTPSSRVASTKTSSSKCGICNRSGLHPESEACALTPFSVGQRGAVFATLKYRQQQKAYKYLKQELAQNPSTDLSALITAARKAAE